MTHTELRHRILDLIREITGREYIYPILVTDMEPQGYSVGFGHHQWDPIWYSADLPDDLFLQFMRRELCRAGFLRVLYGRAVRDTAGGHRNVLASPYDNPRTRKDWRNDTPGTDRKDR